MADDTKKAQAWRFFDPIVTEAPGRRTNPWVEPGVFAPDYEVLQRLLGVPLLLDAATTSGVPALALDVWVAYELRRAGLDPDRVWPREEPPRVISKDVLDFVEGQPNKTAKDLRERIAKGGRRNGGAASGNILGKNYLKQVDVILSHWSTGPEVLISTKRMDSSFGNNAANRVEESYGDAKNLRLRHPQSRVWVRLRTSLDLLGPEPRQGELAGRLAHQAWSRRGRLPRGRANCPRVLRTAAKRRRSRGRPRRRSTDRPLRPGRTRAPRRGR